MKLSLIYIHIYKQNILNKNVNRWLYKYMERVRMCEFNSERKSEMWRKRWMFGLRNRSLDYFLSWQYSQVSMATIPSCPDDKTPAGLDAVIMQATGWTLVADATQLWGRTVYPNKGEKIVVFAFKLRAFSLPKETRGQTRTLRNRERKAKDDFMNCIIHRDTQGLPACF